MTDQELLDLKDEIEQAKTELSELKGQLIGVSKQFKDDWSCNTITAVETLIDKMDKKITTMKEQKRIAMEELEKQLNQNQ